MEAEIQELRDKVAELQESIDRGTEIFLEIGTSSDLLVNELVSGGFNLPSIFGAAANSFIRQGRDAILEFLANPSTELTAVQLDFMTRAARAALEVLTPGVPSPRGVAAPAAAPLAELGGFLDFIHPQSFPLEGLLETLSQLLLNPSRVPGEPCLAPTPLLSDLLDLALGKLQGGIGAIFGKVGSTVLDLLLPAATTGDDLGRFVQAILDDPITAALNLVLGARNQTDCVVEAGLGVGASVIETQVMHLEARLLEVLA